MVRYGLMLLVLLSSAWAEASARPARTQKVTYPDGRVVYEAAQEKAADKINEAAKVSGAVEQVSPADAAIGQESASEKVPTLADSSPVVLLQSPTASDPKPPCNNCGDSTTPSTGECKQYNPPSIITSGGAGCDKPCPPTDNQNPQIGKLEEVPGTTISFYGKHSDFQANALIPKVVKNQRENLLFGKVQYGVECCKYAVCVVTQCQCVETRNCELRSKSVKMRAFRRNSNNTIDVYVLNEPGFPVQWVLYLELTNAEFQTKFPGSPLP